MSNVDQLINELCPQGVEFYKLGEVSDFNTGQQLNLSEMLQNEKYPVYNGGIAPSGYYHLYNNTEDSIAISQGGASAGFVNFVKTKFWAGAHCYVVKPKIEFIDNKFL